MNDEDKEPEINVVVAPRLPRWIPRRLLRKAAAHALRAQRKHENRSLSIVLVGDRAMRRYNLRYHKVPLPTDVLSFPSTQKGYLGDIIISYDTARRNARAAGWGVSSELQLLVIHGVLHLLGYGDETPVGRAAMQRKQHAILSELGVHVPENEPDRLKSRKQARSSER